VILGGGLLLAGAILLTRDWIAVQDALEAQERWRNEDQRIPGKFGPLRPDEVPRNQFAPYLLGSGLVLLLSTTIYVAWNRRGSKGEGHDEAPGDPTSPAPASREKGAD
jgi:hypothetical protein